MKIKKYLSFPIIKKGKVKGWAISAEGDAEFVTEVDSLVQDLSAKITKKEEETND